MLDAEIQSLTTVIRTLFRGARAQSTDTFQDWALEQIKALIPFDSGKWATGSVHDGQPVAHHIHLHRFPENTMLDYHQRILRQDPLLLMAIGTPGVTFCLDDVMSREAYVHSPLYLDYAKALGIEQAITTIVKEPVTGLLSVIALFRADCDRAFTVRDKKLKTLLSPLLAEAHNLNLFPGTATTASAICDIKGLLRSATPGFGRLLLHEWPDWQGPTLHFVPEYRLSVNTETTLQGKCICIHLSLQNGLVLVQLRPLGAVDALSLAEKRVSQYLLQGHSNKEIATRLEISSKTVANHLHRIYHKLAVPNRQQAIASLLHTPP